MSVHLMVVSFKGKEEFSDEDLLHLLGYDENTAGKLIHAKPTYFDLDTEVPNTKITHIYLQDEKISSDNLTIIFENQDFVADKENLQEALAEIISRTGIDILSADYFKGVNNDFVFIVPNSSKLIMDQIANSVREQNIKVVS